MRDKLIILGLLIALSGLLWWQVQENGELSAVNNQYEEAIDDMRQAMTDLADRNIQTNNMLANTRRQFQETQQQAQDLADDLRNQNDACLNGVIPDAVVNRVLEFQSNQNGNYPRDSP